MRDRAAEFVRPRLLLRVEAEPRDEMLRVETEDRPEAGRRRADAVLRLRSALGPLPAFLAELLFDEADLRDLLLPALLPEDKALALRERDDDREEPLRALLLDLCAMDISPSLLLR